MQVLQLGIQIASIGIMQTLLLPEMRKHDPRKRLKMPNMQEKIERDNEQRVEAIIKTKIRL